MKLHELVKLRNELEKALDLSVIQGELEKNSARLRSLKHYADPEYAESLEAIAQQHSSIIEQALIDSQSIQETVDNINQDINSLAGKFFEESYQLELQYVDPDTIRSTRNINLPEQIEQLLLSRIQLHSNWKYPALEIGCRDGEWTKHLVASDPLYIADVFDEFLHVAVEQFTPVYQGRIRKYLIDNFHIEGLPENQFSFIFSYNFFNYLSLDSIKQYLIQAKAWLRDGGTMLFTYNNADMPAGAGYAENYFMSYVPKSLLVAMCEGLGFTVIHTQEFDPAIAWIEIKKSGTLNTVKAGQVLGEVKYRQVESVEKVS
jgi:hypothetical protein